MPPHIFLGFPLREKLFPLEVITKKEVTLLIDKFSQLVF